MHILYRFTFKIFTCSGRAFNGWSLRGHVIHFVSIDSTLCLDFDFDWAVNLCSTVCSILCFDLSSLLCFDQLDFMFRLGVWLNDATVSTVCFDFVFDYRAFWTMGFRSSTDMCLTRVDRNINGKFQPGGDWMVDPVSVLTCSFECFDFFIYFRYQNRAIFELQCNSKTCHRWYTKHSSCESSLN